MFSSLEPLDAVGEVRSLDEIRHEVVVRAVQACQGNKAKAARELGVSRATVHRILRARRARALEPAVVG